MNTHLKRQAKSRNGVKLNRKKLATLKADINKRRNVNFIKKGHSGRVILSAQVVGKDVFIVVPKNGGGPVTALERGMI